MAIFNLMEDAATAEISRTQVWQWLHHGAKLSDGRVVTPTLVEACLADEMAKLQHDLGLSTVTAGRFTEAIDLFRKLVTDRKLDTFLTLSAYRLIA